MQKRRLIALFGLLVIAPGAYAGLQDDLNDRWRGAWLIVNPALHSNCNGTATNNTISYDLVSGSGLVNLPGGELARVTRIDSKRRRVDVFVSIAEPMLVERQDGPFTLYDERECQVEIMFELGDDRSSDLGVPGIEGVFGRWVERYTTEGDAELSANWNGRERADYPQDYDRTLAEYRLWKIEQHNEAIEERMAEVSYEAERVLGQVVRNAQFGEGLSYGLVAMRENIEDTGCEGLVASSVATFSESYDAPSDAWGDGYDTGQELAYYLEMSRQLGGCYIDPQDPRAFSDVLTY